MNTPSSRRDFVKRTTVFSFGLAAAPLALRAQPLKSPGEKLIVGVMGLGVEYPTRITCNGGRYHFRDDQETPDTTLAAYDFGGKGLLWDGSSCHPRGGENLAFVTWYGDNGSLAQIGAGYKVFDPKGKQLGEGTGPGGDKVHIENFLKAIRGEAKLNSEIAVGQTSTLLCHLGNIAHRTGRTIHFDPTARKMVGDRDAEKLWAREYREGWEPKV